MRITTAIALAVALGSCVGEPHESARDAYVGGARCKECHAAQAAAWTGSHHDLAMREASDETVLGDFRGATLTHGGVTSTFLRDGDRFLVRTEGREGALADFEIAFTLGVTPLQQYVVPFPGGRYQMLPLAWDTRPAAQGGQRWFPLYAGEDTGPASPFHWTRPTQTWNTRCAECHTTDLRTGFDPVTRTFETTWAEIDVSCEACHGAGAAHVAIAQDHDEQSGEERPPEGWGFDADLATSAARWRLAPGAAVARVVPPAGNDEEIEVCARCHSRRATLVSPPDPGAPLHDAYAVSLLREDLYYADGQISEEVYEYGSFVQSRMYAAGVTCSDCHDAHSLELRAEGNALCSRCHAAARYDVPAHHNHRPATDGALCVSCHMPETTYMVVDPRRDHGLRVPRPDLTVEIGVPNPCNRCHADRPAAWAAEAVRAWYGRHEPNDHYALVLDAARRGDPAAVPGLAALAADTASAAIVRGTALSLLGRFRVEGVPSALRAGLADPEPLVRLGAVQGLAGLDAGVVAALALPSLADSVAAVRLEVARRLARLPRGGLAPEVADRLDRAVEELERVLATHAAESESWVALGDLFGDRARPREAEAAYRTALELDSADLAAALNLADLLRAEGRDGEGARVLAMASTYHAEAPELLHAVGLLRVREGERDEALIWLARAAAADPSNPRFAYVHGVAVASAGDMSGAIEILERALAIHAFDPQILSALASYNSELGRTVEARGYAGRLIQVAPDDPVARTLLGR